MTPDPIHKRPADLPAWFPSWASQLADLYFSGTTAAFVLHGWPKMQNPTGWMDAMPGAPPGFVQAIPAVFEFVGGILLMAGLFTRVAALALVSVMIGALALVHIPKGDPFVAPGRSSSELASVYLAFSLLIAATGAGAYALDAVLFERGRAARPVMA